MEQNVEQQYVDCTKRRCNPSETKVQPNIGLVKLQFYPNIDPVQAAGRWRVYVFLLWLFERMRFTTQTRHPPTSRDVAAATMFVRLGGSVSLAWAARNGPQGKVPRTGTRLPQLVVVLRERASLLLSLTDLPFGQCPLRRLTHAEAARVEAIAWGSAMQMFRDWVRLQVPPTPSPLIISQSEPFLPPPPTSELPPPSPHPPPSEPGSPPPPTSELPPVSPHPPPAHLRLRMLQFRELEANARVPPVLLGIETAGRHFAAAKKVWEAIHQTLPREPLTAFAILVHGDPSSNATRLKSFINLVPGGVEWRKCEERLDLDLEWVHNEDAQDAMHWHHQHEEPLLAFHADGTTLELGLVKGGNFLDCFAMNTPQRRRVAPWEAAIAIGTVEALLSTPLSEHYTLAEAIQHGLAGFENRHGQMHVKFFTHTLSMCASQALLAPVDGELGRWLPLRSSHGEPLSPKRALLQLVTDFAPFATRLYYGTVPAHEQLEANILGRILQDCPFSYFSTTFYSCKKWADLLPGLRQKCSGKRESNHHENGEGKGMDLHTDKHSGYTIVLVFGAMIKGFAQLYPTLGVGAHLQ